MRFARDAWSCDARRALGGVWRSPHEVGTDTRNEYRKIVAESRYCSCRIPVLYSNECCRETGRQQFDGGSGTIRTARARAASSVLSVAQLKPD